MARGLRKWSKTAATNANADSGINWAEGMAPSAVNDSARAEMASASMWRDDNNGSLAGTLATATYSVTSNQTFDALAAGDTIAIQLGSAMPATALLNVDALGAKPLRPAAGVEFAGGEYVANTVIRASYFSSNSGEWIVTGAFASVANSKLATMAANTIKANATGSTATPTDVTLGAGLAFSGSALVLSGTTQPQGRLTLTTATPVLATDASAQSTVYYTPYIGNIIPLYDGTNFNLTSFSELSMVMSGANFAASTIYDLFVALDSGTMRLGIGPAWATATAGSGARGTGAGTTELQRLNGLWTNKVSATLRYASGSTFTVAANQGTYVGSLQMDGTNSQVTCNVAVGVGVTRKFGLWNAFNRVPISLRQYDNNATWGYNTSAWRSSNANSANSVSVFTGLAEEMFSTRFVQTGTSADNNTSSLLSNGIGWNSTSSPSGKNGFTQITVGAISLTHKGDMVAEYTNPPALGLNVVSALENGLGSNSATFLGGVASYQLSATYHG